MQEKKYFNVYYYDFNTTDYSDFVNEIRKQMRITVRDNQWKDIPVEDFEIVEAEANKVSDIKPYRVNIIRESSIYKRIVDALMVLSYGAEPGKLNNVWIENLHNDDLAVTNIRRTEASVDDRTIDIAYTMVRLLLSKYAPSRISSSSTKTCAQNVVRKMFDHFGFKSQVTRWSDKQI